MGVPQLFNFLADKYTEKYKTVHWDINYQSDYLYLDYNSLIHNVKAKYFSYSNPNINKIKEMSENDKIKNFIKEIIKYTQFIFNTIKPRKYFVICIDGAVPQAKVHLQRLRRFGKVKDQEYILNIKQKYNVNQPELFDSNLITPGTTFLEKFSKEMIKYIKGKKFGKFSDNITIIFDDASKPGEGENKILAHLKSQNLNQNDKITIYGKDADLIPLSMSVNINNIEILREPDIYSRVEQNYQNHDFILFSIDNLKEALISEYKLEKFNYDNFIKDFTFLTLLIGNDFVKKLPHLQLGNNIHKNGWHILLNIYIKIMNTNGGVNLINKLNNGKININIPFFTEVLKELTKIEKYSLENTQNHYDNFRYNPRETEQIKQDIEFYTHAPYTDNRNPFYDKYSSEMNKINYYDNNWKNQYYEHFFGINTNDNKTYNNFRKLICIHYIESLIWTINYYLSDNISWHFYYQFRVAPFASDLLHNIKNIKNINSFKFKIESPFTPLEQLFFVLPSSNSSYLPKTFAKLMNDDNSPIIQYFPIDFNLDVLYGRVQYKSNPILPLFNIDNTLKILKKQKLTKTEIIRNTLNSEYFEFSY
jgi:5'-3' exonuclease